MAMTKDKLIALGVLALLLAGLGGAASLHSGGLVLPSVQPPGAKAPETPYGAIESVSGDTIVISSHPPYLDHALTYTLALTANTTLIRHSNKTSVEFKKELEAYRAGQASSTPIGYTALPATRADLALGAVIEAPGATKRSDGTWRAPSIIIDIAATSTTR